MGKDWDYAKLSKNASEAGGVEKYINNLQRYGFQKGILTMFPVCVAGCVITYKKGRQIVDFIKDSLRIVTKEETDYAKQQLMDMESNIVFKCPIKMEIKQYMLTKLCKRYTIQSKHRSNLESNVYYSFGNRHLIRFLEAHALLNQKTLL